jgi:hypothetical protein
MREVLAVRRRRLRDAGALFRSGFSAPASESRPAGTPPLAVVHICGHRDLGSIWRGQTLQRRVEGPVPGISVPVMAPLGRVPRASGEGDPCGLAGNRGSGQRRKRADRSGSARHAKAVVVDRSIGVRRATAALRTRRAERGTRVLLECPGTPWLWTGRPDQR